MFPNSIPYDDESPLSLQDRIICRPINTSKLTLDQKIIRRPNKSTTKKYDLFNGMCNFCKQNSEHPSVYTSHSLKDERGRITCPILRKHKCPRCGKSGDEAHTLKYCPDRSTTKHAFLISEAIKTRKSNGKRRDTVRRSSNPIFI